MHPETIIHFWFTELNHTQRFAKDAVLDALVRQRFEATLQAGIAGELFEWRRSALGRLAEIVVLDQFPRNMYRDTPAAFSQDAQALALAQELVDRGLDKDLPIAQRAFAYLPYMHSESLLIHQQALVLFSQPGLEGSLAFEHKHREILEQFGRYPHRNSSLGRPSTALEITFLKQPGSSF